MSKDEFADAVEAGTSGESWKPQDQPVLIGTYKAKKDNVGINNSMVYVIQEDDKEEPTNVWGSVVLDSRFEEIPTRSRVRIEYTGDVKGKGPKPYKNFSVKYVAPTDAVADVFPDAEQA